MWDWPLVAAMLGGAGIIDYVTGTSHVEAHFYGLPVIFATWKRGWVAGVAVCLVAAVVNAATEWAVSGYHPSGSVITDEVVRFALFLAGVTATAILRRQDRTIRAQRDALSLQNRQAMEEMEAGRDLQMALTQRPVTVPEVDLAEYLQPARTLCGDILHVSVGPDGCLAILLADASGKGSPAALAGAVMLGLLQDLPSRYTSPAETLDSLDRRLVDFLPTEMFITAFYGILDPKTGSLTYANAGHERPVLFTGCGREDLNAAGMPVGMWGAGSYEDRVLRLSPGDLLFVYSDGLTDHRLTQRERVTRERVVDLLDRLVSLPCDRLVQALVRETVGEGIPSDDDVTILALRYRGDGPRHETPPDSVIEELPRRQPAVSPC